MSALARIVLASGNAGKLRELQALLAPAGVDLVAQATLGVAEAEEPFGTFLENALAKARHASRATGLPAIADDSGVCVPVLGGAPGVRSARWAADVEGGERSDAANNARLVRELAPHADRSAYYYCALVLVRSPDDPQPVVADGTWFGEILAEPRGAGGFGYDPHFLLPALGRTVAELDATEKNGVSHRGRAMRALLDKLVEARLVSAPRTR
ncbi:MAG TPA: RdgB/HAM1 family non-canonical purine NTP pyrophosphatase [Burkholderiaceae bacterium]|nr:RdgB/HAM1 family non-canonical purine NTP pyrophosphatase [Burkholderiaceae bacterium]